jgi:superfamily II RNA helicase
MAVHYYKCNVAEAPVHKVAEPAISYSFPLDPFQEHAIAALDQGHNVLVCAKTGSGKTLVAEYGIADALKRGKRVFYTTPIKSLSNQKFHDLTEMYKSSGHSVGIMTGDIKYNPQAEIVVMTTEILRNLLYKVGTATEHVGLTAALSMNHVGCVVFDECHYINDKDRGAVWEESMMLLPADVRMVLLSATLDRPETFADWLGEIKGVPCALIQTGYRVVPLTHYVINHADEDGPKLIPIMDARENFKGEVYKHWTREQKKAALDQDKYREKVKALKAAGVEGGIEGKVAIHSFTHTLNQTVELLKKDDLLPAVCFVFSRKDCERYAALVDGSVHAGAIEDQELLPTFKDGQLIFEKASLGKEYKGVEAQRVFDFHLRRHKKSLETLPVYHTLRELVGRGLGFHHSGLLPVLKEVLELLYSGGYLKLLFCTETFAVGLNMPTRTVLFTGLKKYSDDCDGMRLLRNDEYLQMAGRAGRRGKDTIGYVIYVPDRAPLDWTEVAGVLRGALPPLQSTMRFGYEFLLKILNGGGGWLDVMRRSYWYRCHDVARAEAEAAVATALAAVDRCRPAAEFLGDLETFDGWASAVKGAGNSERKVLQRKMEEWRNKHMGPKWADAGKAFEGYKKARVVHERALVVLESYAGYAEPVEHAWKFLATHGYIDAATGALTRKGQAASECNESHALLATALFYSGKLKGLLLEDIIGVCAVFVEGGKKEDEPPLTDASMMPAVMDVYHFLESARAEFQTSEAAHGLRTDVDYWRLYTGMIAPLRAWVSGAPSGAPASSAPSGPEESEPDIHISALCADHGIFEGNFVRSVLKVANVLDELCALATLESDTKLLETLEGARARLVRDVVVPDSLYLHL